MNRDRISFHEWRALKKHFGIKNSEISLVLGIDRKSVQNATAPSFKGQFPAWAKIAIWIWKKAGDNETLLKAEIVKLKNELNEKTKS